MGGLSAGPLGCLWIGELIDTTQTAHLKMISDIPKRWNVPDDGPKEVLAVWI